HFCGGLASRLGFISLAVVDGPPSLPCLPIHRVGHVEGSSQPSEPSALRQWVLQLPAHRPDVTTQDISRRQRGVAAPVVAIPGVSDDLVYSDGIAEAQRAVQ